MTRTMLARLPLFLLIAFLGAAACQDRPPGASEEAGELAEDQLTIEDVRAFARARAALAEMAATDSTVWRGLRPLSAGATPYGSVDEAARALELHPGVRETLSATDVSPEAYVRTRFALQQALLAHDLERAGGEGGAPAAVPPENVALVAEHREEIERLLASPETAPPDTAGGG